MKELQNVKNQTPIEIALGIDENGMTTAKKLYEFLCMDTRNYSRWAKSNITENQFAEENADYWVTVTKEENSSSKKSFTGRGNTQDYKLSAGFAKKLSMIARKERGEQARQYFVSVEKRMKEIAEHFQDMSPELRAVITVDKRVTQVERKADGLRQEFEQFKEDMPILGIEEDKIKTAVKRKGVQCLGGKASNAYNDRSLRGKLYSDMYRQLYRQFGITTYKAIKRNQCDRAVGVIEGYEPPFILEEQIVECNAQMNMEV